MASSRRRFTSSTATAAILDYGMEGDATISSQVDWSPWAQQCHAELANKFAHASGFSTKPMDEA